MVETRCTSRAELGLASSWRPGAERPASSARRASGASRATASPPLRGPVGWRLTPGRSPGHGGRASAPDHQEEPMNLKRRPRLPVDLDRQAHRHLCVRLTELTADTQLFAGGMAGLYD